jgi:hypothetical protein
MLMRGILKGHNTDLLVSADEKWAGEQLENHKWQNMLQTLSPTSVWHMIIDCIRPQALELYNHNQIKAHSNLHVKKNSWLFWSSVVTTCKQW